MHRGCYVDLHVVGAESGYWGIRNFIENFGVGDAGSDPTAIDWQIVDDERNHGR